MELLSPTVLSTACGLMATLMSASLAIYVFKKEAFEKRIEEKPDDAAMMERARKYFSRNYLLLIALTCGLAIVYDFVSLLSKCSNAYFLTISFAFSIIFFLLIYNF